MLEFEGSSEEMNNRASRSKKPLVTGLGTRIKRYEQDCWKASGKVREPKDVKIMELSELKELQKNT